MKLTKNHDPANNVGLLYRSGLSLADLPQAMAEAYELFYSKRTEPKEEKREHQRLLPRLKKLFFRPLLDNRPFHQASNAFFIGEDGIPYPVWKKVLDKEEIKIENLANQEVNVEDFGAVGDGQTDNTEAFKKAIGNGKVKVQIPEGVFIVKEVKLPSWTFLSGAGKGKTVLKLQDRAPRRRRLLTNHSHRDGNHHIKVEDITLDWNLERLKKTGKTKSINNFSSCLTFANVTCGWVKRVEAINAGLHGFDISSTIYTYAGDATRAKGGSKYIWLDKLTGYGFGDDGVTTHHSDHILISNSHMAAPSGRAHKEGVSNSNGFEVDDGSRGVWLIHNSSAHCFGGIEIKAHKTAAAAARTHIIGHLSFRDNRSFNFRHIGHHLKEDPESLTAYDIVAVNLQAVEPVRTNLYKNSAPRALVVSAYRNVVVHHFTAIGDPAYDYRNQPVLAVQYRARNVFLHHINVEGFSTASSDIKIFGGPGRAGIVSVADVYARLSAPVTVEVGENVEDCSLSQIKGTVLR